MAYNLPRASPMVEAHIESAVRSASCRMEYRDGFYAVIHERWFGYRHIADIKALSDHFIVHGYGYPVEVMRVIHHLQDFGYQVEIDYLSNQARGWVDNQPFLG